MGVTGLWTVVQPCARPIKIETLNKKRLAVDASIWIYQFLKAVRDKDGNALRNSHVVGFFRRICKLLFVGIQPVFVFDGGAPALKRQTISARKQRREGRKEDAVRTAGKLLALQMQRAAEEEERNRKRAEQRGPEPDEEELPENLVYVDELQMTAQERQQNRKFKKKDQYHLPEIDGSMAEMGGPNDPRIMSLEELEAYARQFDTGEDINVYDFSKIDFDSPFFVSLPASDRYNILNAARLRSRLRMGYSKEQLDTMFPDRMAFSKFQIERVTERNELTQRLMNLNGMNDDAMFGINGSGRVAGEKGREYVLVKNDGVEGGWALGVVTSKDEGEKSRPIDVDELEKQAKIEANQDEWDDDEQDFEDVPIEGLNRLPRQATASSGDIESTTRKRRALHASRKSRRPRQRAVELLPAQDDPESLFVTDALENVSDDGAAPYSAADVYGTDDEDLDRAIALSLQQDGGDVERSRKPSNTAASSMVDEQESPDVGQDLDLFQQSRAEEGRPVPKGSGKAIAHIVNGRANKSIPAVQAAAQSDSEEDDMDFQSALAESRNDKHKVQTAPTLPSRVQRETKAQAPPSQPPPLSQTKKAPGFDGPLPFEKLNLGSSLLGKKKMEDLDEKRSGGFEKDTDAKRTEAQPLPPWFAGNLHEDIAAQKKIEQQDRQKAKDFGHAFQFSEPSVLRRQQTQEIIDLEAPPQSREVIDLDGSQRADVSIDTLDNNITSMPHNSAVVVSMGNVADSVRADPPKAARVMEVGEPLGLEYSHPGDLQIGKAHIPDPEREDQTKIPDHITPPSIESESVAEAANDMEIDWSESDREEVDRDSSEPSRGQPPNRDKAAANGQAGDAAPSPSPDFEDVDIPTKAVAAAVDAQVEEQQSPPETRTREAGDSSASVNQTVVDAQDGDDYGYYSDSEDDELMRQLAVEAEEHARFASTLNHKSQQQNIQDYEKELKQLRSQQKKDRRDADEVSHIMITECQQLLRLFGLPYITAPMEAEAQCAELVQLGLVDGIVTDDSDCFLFGGTRIYKNMFNQAKFVECYLASDLEKEFDLTRSKLIGIAQLLGSDYTEGLTGVGPVSALEILSEFSSLADFRDWWQGVQMNTIPKTADAGNAFRKKFRRNATKLFLPPAFPDPRVDLAYSQPEVDSDPSPFQWGVPDLDALRSFLMATIGWSSERTDEVLVPVIKDMNQRLTEGTQSNITAFFQGSSGAGYAPRKRLEQGSKRIGNALDRMAEQAKRKRKASPDASASSAGDSSKRKSRRSNA